MTYNPFSCVLRLFVVLALLLLADSAFGQTVKVVNIIPNARSGEENQDSEPNLAVNPNNASQIAGSAFTPSGGFCGANLAPIYVSTNGGNTWALNCIVPSQTGSTAGTGDITVRFAGGSDRLFAGILRIPGNFRLNILRTNNFTSSTAMTVLVDRNLVDQPYVQAISAGGNDRVFVGNNDLTQSTFFTMGATGRSATMDLSNDAGALTPTFNTVRLEARNTSGQDGPPIRPAVHSDGTVYGIFYRWTSPFGAAITADVVVVRDDSWGTGAPSFSALLDPSDSQPGRFVVRNVTVPWAGFSQPAFGQERFVGSNLSIAVDPNNSSTVYVAWADRVGTTDYTLHVRRSLDRGGTWSADLRTITNATNPALAINSAGKVGFLYQQLTGTGMSQRWVTHLERSSDAFATIQDLVLADVPANTPPVGAFVPYIGDYVHLMTVGGSFYGIFSANNTPDLANFPNGVTYQRNANFMTNTLLDTDNTTPVDVSIDPFFFRVKELIIDLCFRKPWMCPPPVLDRGLIKIKCLLYPCRVIDPVPRNCLYKFPCPGCLGALCPPFYHVFFEDPEELWQIELFDAEGNPVPHQKFRTRQGWVFSFRPDRKLFHEAMIGNYIFLFEGSEKVKLGAEYAIRTRLETSDRHFRPEEQKPFPPAKQQKEDAK